MKRVLQGIISVVLAPVVLAFAWAFFKTLALAIESGRTFWLGVPDGFKWMVVGGAIFGLGHVLLARTSLSGIFKPGWAEWFWRKTIRWRPASPQGDPPSRQEQEAPPPPAALRMIPYCLPVVLIAAILLVNVANWIWDLRYHDEITGIVCGFLLVEHLVWVGRDMRERNPNMSSFGYALTVVVVLWVNLEVLGGLTSLVLPSFSFMRFNRTGVEDAAGMYQGLWESVRRLLR